MYDRLLTADHAYRFINQIDLMDIGLFILAIFVISLVVRTIRNFSEWTAKKFPSKRMIVFGWVPVANFLIYFIGIFAAFYIIFEPRREFLIAFIISGFIAIGFAIKDVITSIITGIVLLVDQPFQVGDRITFQNHYGEIVKIGLVSVKILTLDESIVTIPNIRFLSDSVSSSSAGDLGMMTTVDVHVSLEADLYKIKEILKQESQISQYVATEGEIVIVGNEVLGVNGTVTFVMRIKCIIKDARFEKAFQTDLLLRINEEFKKHAIKFLPYA